MKRRSLFLTVLSVLIMVFAMDAWSANTKHKFKFEASDAGKYNVDYTDRLKIRGGRLYLLGCYDSQKQPYVQMNASNAMRFLRAKKLKHYGRNLEAIRYILSRDGGTTWYWCDPESSRDWVASNGTYDQATSYDASKINFGRFRRRLRGSWKESLIVRIFFKYPYGYCKTEADTNDVDIIYLDSLDVEVDDNREVDNVVITNYPDTVIDTMLVPQIVRDTIMRTVVHTDTVTVKMTDTVVQVDTVIVKEPVVRVDTVVINNTILHTDTVITVQNDTVFESELITILDTVFLTDTLIEARTDTLTLTDTITNIVTETVVQVDTLVERDTITLVNTDTVTITQIQEVYAEPDTIIQQDTIFITNDVITVDTFVVTKIVNDTVISAQNDTVFETDTVTTVQVVRDTFTQTDTIHVVDTVTVVERDTVIQTITQIDTVIEKPYEDYNADCDTCKPICGGPIVVQAGDTVELHAHAFNDSGEYLETIPVPAPEDDDDIAPQGGSFVPELTKDEIVQCGPWYYHLIVQPNVMIDIKIFVKIENNLVELRNFSATPGDTLVLVAVGVDSFGNQIGEVDVDWFATGDSAGADGIGAFIGSQSGGQTKIIAGPSLGELGIRFEGDTIITSGGVSMEVVCMTFPIKRVDVRDSCCGGGNVWASSSGSGSVRQMAVNDTARFYVAAYDSNGDFMNDMKVFPDAATGVVSDHISLAFNNSLLVNPEQEGTGSFQVSYTSGNSDQKVTIEVHVNVGVQTAYRLEIRTGPNGTGELLDSLEDDVFTSIGQLMDLYASAVDEDGNHICDTVVEWTASANVTTKLWTYSGDRLRVCADSIREYGLSASLPGGDVEGTDTVAFEVLEGVEKIILRTDSSGGGAAWTGVDTSMTVDNILTLWAAGYDSNDTYVGDVTAKWTGTFSSNTVSRTGKYFYFTPTTSSDTGTITAYIVTVANLPDSAVMDPEEDVAMDTVKDVTGDIKIGIGAPAHVVLSSEPSAIALDDYYQFSAVVTDWRGNEYPGTTPIAWAVTGSVGSITTQGNFHATAEGDGRVIASYGLLADTSASFDVIDGEMMTDDGGVYTFDCGVTITVPAQSGLAGNVLDVDLHSNTVSLSNFYKVRGPYTFENCTKKSYSTAVTIDYNYATANLDTLTSLGKTAADIRLYRYDSGEDQYVAVHACSNNVSESEVTVTTKQIHDYYVLGVDLQEPDITVFTVSPETLSAGSPVTVTLTATDNILNNKAYIYYKKGGDTVYTVDSTEFDATEDTYTVTVPGGMVGKEGLAIYAVINDGLTEYVSSEDASVDGYISPIVQVTNQIMPNTVVQETTWVVFTLPYEPEETSPKAFFSNFGRHGYHWKIATVEGGEFLEYDTTAENFDMETGRLYWFVTGYGGSFIRIPSAYTSPVTDTQEVALSSTGSGWAAFGIQFGYNIRLADVLAANASLTGDLSGIMCTDGNSWSIVDPDTGVLEPWKGYYVRYKGSGTATLKIPPAVQETPAAKAVAKVGEWTAGIYAVSNGTADDMKILGNLDASSKRCLATPLPPKGMNNRNGVQLGFKVAGKTGGYFTDFRKGAEQGAVWEAAVKDLQKAKGVTVHFDNFGNEKTAFGVFDPVRNLFFNVTESKEYSFVADDQESRVLKVIAGSEAFLEEASQFWPKAPERFELSQNYPNPFNPVTSIRFQVPELKGTANMPGAENASLRVYNVRGQMITTLYQSPIQAGYYTANWNGRDIRGRHCASGTYIYRLMIGDKFTKSIRMTLLK